MSITHLTALYETTGSYFAWLRFIANNVPTVHVTVIHRTITGGVSSYFLHGYGQSQDIRIQDGETLTISVRDGGCDGPIVADGHFEVDLSLIEELAALLVPCSLHRIIFDQCEGSVVDRALQRAITEVLAVVEGRKEEQVL